MQPGFLAALSQVNGRLDQLDDNVTLGLFSYPTGDVGPDGTHEIDLEFARWGDHEKQAVKVAFQRASA